MTQQEFKKKIDDCDSRISVIHEEKQDLINQFKATAEFKEGDKVIVMRRGTPNVCFISVVKIGWRNEIEYEFSKAKKDGTQSGNSAGIYTYESIEHYEKEKGN